MTGKVASFCEYVENGVLVVFGFKKKTKWKQIDVNSFEELYAHETEILRRIQETPNGGILYAFNPLLLLKDIKVELGLSLLEAWHEKEPRLKILRESDYERMKANPVVADVRIKVRGLFHSSQKSA
jgi:hypothetical protein